MSGPPSPVKAGAAIDVQAPSTRTLGQTRSAVRPPTARGPITISSERAAIAARVSLIICIVGSPPPSAVLALGLTVTGQRERPPGFPGAFFRAASGLLRDLEDVEASLDVVREDVVRVLVDLGAPGGATVRTEPARLGDAARSLLAEGNAGAVAELQVTGACGVPGDRDVLALLVEVEDVAGASTGTTLGAARRTG